LMAAFFHQFIGVYTMRQLLGSPRALGAGLVGSGAPPACFRLAPLVLARHVPNIRKGP